ncbi:MAG: DUF805 domain-containing protein [Rhodomicrobium sp.]|jgi:uncharacterized membrane protein YhaH (DUF805 family)
MSWGDVFFGFRGRIGRKVYLGGSVLLGIAGVSFIALLSYLATGNPLAPEVWERPADRSGLWGPVWLAYFGFLVWPSTALAVKRLHDRDRPVWVWYAYYTLSLAVSLTPLKTSLGADANAISSVFGGLLGFFWAYIFVELSVFRGAPGPNAHGPDPLPLDYYGGDYNFWSWMFALEGRINRWKWWLGVFILAGVFIAISLVTGLAMGGILERYPEFQQHLNEPEWFNSKEAQPLISKLVPWVIAPSLIFAVVMWSAFALSVKRLHDRGLSTWLILVVVLPFFGVGAGPSISENATRIALLLLTASAIWSVLQFGILKGETGPNRHGPDPVAR